LLNRISTFLMFTSASLVSLALAGQATRFSDMFFLLAGVVLFVDVVIGFLTQVRVVNASHEDLMYVIAMNRLRAAYVELDPGIAPYLMASSHDDLAGSVQTYFFLGKRRAWSHVAGSGGIFISTANAALIAILTALLASSLGARTTLAAVIGVLFGLAFFGGSSVYGYRSYVDVWRGFTPVSPTPVPSTGDAG